MSPATVPCPQCAAQLKLPPGAIPGRQVRCPGCTHIFEIPAGSGADRADAVTRPIDTPADRAGARTQPLPDPADRAEAETRRSVAHASDAWADVAPAAAPKPRPAQPDDEDDAVQSYGLARRDGEAPLLIGTVGRFELRRFLGQGAFGKVYLAHDPQLDRAVALKVPRHPPTDDRGVRQFMQEATSAARLKHPNIVAIFEAGQAGSTLFIASEYVEGEPLSVRLSERPPKPRLAVRWVRDLARAAHYAHELGVVHRDIKPANVMIGRDDRAQLMDFGLALRRDTDHGAATGVVGTPAYMAPEQARGEQADVGPKSDQFALAVVLYEVLAGAAPFRGSVDEVLRQIRDPEFRPPPPDRLRPEVPVGLSAVCMKALAKRPEDRYRTAGDFATDLQRWLDGKRVSAGKPPAGTGEGGPLRRAVRWVRKNPRRAGAAFAVLLLLAGGVLGGLWVWNSVREARRLREEVRRTEMARDADLFRERGARFGSQGKPAEGLALLARSYELAAELQDADRLHGVEAAFGEAAWDLPPPPGVTGEAAKAWRVAGGLALGIPVPDAGEGQPLPHAGPADYTGYITGGRVVTGAGDTDRTLPVIRVRDAATNEAVRTLRGKGRMVFALSGRTVFYEDTWRWGVWDTQDNDIPDPKHERDVPRRSGALNPDGTRLVVYGTARSAEGVQLWDVTRMKLLREAGLQSDSVGDQIVGAAVSPDGNRAVFLGRGVMAVWAGGSRDEAFRREHFKPASESPGGEFTAAAFAPGGSFLAVGRAKAVDRWSPAGDPQGVWLPVANVKQIAFSPDGRHVAVVTADGVQVWDTATARAVGPPRHRGAKRTQFRPDGKQLLTAADGDTRVWPHPTVAPDQRPAAVRLWAEATTGLEVTPEGQTRPLSEADRADRRTRFEQLAGLTP